MPQGVEHPAEPLKTCTAAYEDSIDAARLSTADRAQVTSVAGREDSIDAARR